MYKIYHNPRCSKSRETLEILKQNVSEKDIEIIEYLQNVPSVKTLEKILSLLNIPAEKLLRKSEEEFKPYRGQKLTDQQWLEIMNQHPKLIERPIIVKDEQAVIGRPPENVKSLF